MADTPLVKAVLTLLEVMSAEERASVQQHMDTLGLPLTAKSGSVLRLVGCLFTPGLVIRVPDAVEACRSSRPETSEKEVYNALGYLTRRHKIRRVGQGQYVALVRDAPCDRSGAADETRRGSAEGESTVTGAARQAPSDNPLTETKEGSEHV